MNNHDLYLIADDNGIMLDEFALEKTPSISTIDDGQCYIALNSQQLETTSSERAHLAHELGHCITGSFYNRYAALDVRGKHERRANRWAVEYLVPLNELRRRIKQGYTEHWELSEIFNVPDWFMVQAMEYYQQHAPAQGVT